MRRKGHHGPPRPRAMAARPYSPSHIGSVAGGYADLRISGDVKGQLVEILVEHLDHLVPMLERGTLDIDPERKTLDDPDRTRLNYNRTRELAIERLADLESVGSAAVCRLIDDLESHLKGVISRAEERAAKERIGTIKKRHLEGALESLNLLATEDEDGTPAVIPEDPLDGLVTGSTGGSGVLTTSGIRSLARSFARSPVQDDAIEELLLMYYDRAATMEVDLKASITAGSIQSILDHLHQMKDFMMLGWMKKALILAGEEARGEGASKVTLDHVLQVDSRM